MTTTWRRHGNDMNSKKLAFLGTMIAVFAIPCESQAGNIFFKQVSAPGSGAVASDDQMLLNGKKLRGQGAYAQAVQTFEQILKDRPKSSEAHLELSKTLALCGQDERAMLESFESLKLELKNPQARNLLGELFLKKQSWNEAAGQFKQVLELEPRNISARGNLAICLQQLGYTEYAVQQLKAMLKLSPDNQKALYDLAVAQQMSEQTEPAIGTYLELIKINPKNSLAYAGLGKCYVQKKDYKTAIAAENEAIKLDSNNQFAFLVLCEAYDGSGSKADSIDAYRKGIALNPKDAAAKEALSNLLHQKVAVNPGSLTR
jgi:tetratricopeptide (TPR) repeat protein